LIIGNSQALRTLEDLIKLNGKVRILR